MRLQIVPDHADSPSRRGAAELGAIRLGRFALVDGAPLCG
jgi:hypothetical protein